MTNAEAIEHLKNIKIYSFQDGYTDEAREALDMAIKALEVQEWIPCKPSELPKDKKLLVTHNAFGYRYVTMLFWDMTGWNDNVSDVVAYMPYPEPYRKEEG